MAEDKKPIEKPNLDNVEMHMPEGDAPILDVEPSHKIANGPIILLLVVLLIVILGGMFWWYTELSKQTVSPASFDRPTPEENNEPESTTAEAQTDTLEAVSTSDELGPIEADLAGTNLNTLDAEIIAIEAELENATQE